MGGLACIWCLLPRHGARAAAAAAVWAGGTCAAAAHSAAPRAAGTAATSVFPNRAEVRVLVPVLPLPHLAVSIISSTPVCVAVLQGLPDRPRIPRGARHTPALLAPPSLARNGTKMNLFIKNPSVPCAVCRAVCHVPASGVRIPPAGLGLAWPQSKSPGGCTTGKGRLCGMVAHQNGAGHHQQRVEDPRNRRLEGAGKPPR